MASDSADKTDKGHNQKSLSGNWDSVLCISKTFGGTERTNNDVVTIEDTAVIETWYRPDIKADCRIQNADGKTYEVIGTPENINMRNQILKFKIRAVSGGA